MFCTAPSLLSALSNQAAQFFRDHGCTTNDTNAKYHSRAAMLYKEKLAQLTAEDERKGTNVLVCTWRKHG
jgi:ADP-ribosylation factor GTPase-activating protein 2/3